MTTKLVDALLCGPRTGVVTPCESAHFFGGGANCLELGWDFIPQRKKKGFKADKCTHQGTRRAYLGRGRCLYAVCTKMGLWQGEHNEQPNTQQDMALAERAFDGRRKARDTTAELRSRPNGRTTERAIDNRRRHGGFYLYSAICFWREYSRHDHPPPKKRAVSYGGKLRQTQY